MTQMVNRRFVREKVMQVRADITSQDADALIDDAVRLLGNLVHYKTGGSHEDEDVVAAVLVIGQDVREKK